LQFSPWLRAGRQLRSGLAVTGAIE
jgi:hypothetical protein